jgi:hypothetical protein
VTPVAAAVAQVTPEAAAQALGRARRDGRRVPSTLLQARGREQAYAIQDATLAAIGPIGGWKVGATGPGQAPVCAPLPAAGLVPGVVREVLNAHLAGFTKTEWQALLGYLRRMIDNGEALREAAGNAQRPTLPADPRD